MSFDPKLFTRLINHRVSDERARREDYLTECFAWVLEHDPDLLGGFVQLAFHAHPDRAPGTVEELAVHTQVQVDSANRPDLELSAPGFRLLVECKVDAPYDRGQVERYLAHADQPRGGVLALVPRRARPSSGQWPDGEGFLGVLAWEQVAELLRSLPGDEGATGGFRDALHALLDSFGLVPFDGVVAPWQHPDGTQDPAAVRKILDVLEAASADVRADTELLGRAPPIYAARVLHTCSLISGSGSQPRPVLTFATNLRSCIEPHSRYRYGGFLDASVNVGFQSATAYDSGDLTVEFLVDTRPVPRVGHSVRWMASDEEVVRAVLQGGPWRVPDDLELPWAAEAMAELRAGYEAVVRQVAARVDDAWPEARIEPYDKWGVRLVFGETAEVLEVGGDQSALRERYGRLVRDVYGALFEADPGAPLGRLLLRAMAP